MSSMQIDFFVQVCIAMVPGGCVIRHPDVQLEPTVTGAPPNKWTLWESKIAQPPNYLADDTQGKINLLNISYWMHNARCCFRSGSHFVHKKGTDTEAVERKHLIDEAGYFFEQLWDKKFDHHPAFVSLAFLLSECCAFFVTRLPAFVIINALRWRRSCLIESATS
jgi:hypothetical protein